MELSYPADGTHSHRREKLLKSQVKLLKGMVVTGAGGGQEIVTTQTEKQRLELQQSTC